MDPSKNWAVFIHPSTLKLESFVETLLEPVICRETAKKIELGLHEALVNAVVHGNLSNPNKVIRVRRILTPNWIVWQIQDEGLGIVEDKRVCCLPLNIDVTPPADNVKSPDPFVATAILPLLEETIEFPFTSNAAVRLV